MRLIDADALMPLFIEKANTTDKHGVKFGENWLLDYEDIKDVIDNAPTIYDLSEHIENAPKIDDLSEYSNKLWKLAYERGKAEGRPQGEWIVTERGYECSKCGALHVDDYPFCHMCGVYMTKEAENDGY